MKDDNYINIQGWMIKRLNLSGNELLLYAIIYGFSQDGKSKYRGSLTYIHEATNLSRNTIISNIEKLVASKLIKKEYKNTGNLYSADIALVEKLLVQKLNRGSAEVAPVGSAETEHNNNNTNNKDNNNCNGCISIIKLFEKLDAKNKTYYGNKTQRAKAEFLLKEYGYDKVAELIDVYLAFKSEKYLPSISSPHDMVEKWSKLGDFFRRRQADNNEMAKKWIT